MLVFLFTDIEGSTRLWEAHTDHMGQVIARHDAILQEQVSSCGGRIVKHTGDGIIAVFDGGQPLACTLEIQKRLAAETWPHIGELRIRAGLHSGEALFRPSPGTPYGDYFGPPVNTTARVMAAAWGGQILLTPDVTSLSPLPAGATLLDLGEHLLKNVSAPQRLYQLDHPELPRRAFPPPHTLSGQSIWQAVEEQGDDLARLDPTGIVIGLVVAILVPTLQGELDPASGALEGNLGVLGDMGLGALRAFMAQCAGRLRARQRAGEMVGLPQIQGLLGQELLARWEAGGKLGTAIRADSSQLLQAVQGVEATMAAATGEVREVLARGLSDLGGQFAEFRWMMAGAQQTLAEVRALQQEQLDLQRQQLAMTSLLLQRRQEEAPAILTEMGVEGAAPPAAIPSPTRPRHNLPVQPTPFVGRREELVQIAQRLADPACRLLTVVGPGGMGKSRLAIQAGEEQLTTLRDGVWFVPLASVESVDLLPSTIMEALDVPRFGTQDPQAQLLNYLRGRHLLLILDNFEHLLEGAALVREILTGAPEVKVVATSRERLGLRVEWLLPLQGLGVPEEGDVVEQAAAVVEEYGAVQLFVQCAQQVQPEFSLATAGAESVSRVCQLAGGMPLAIELAAPWTRAMRCQDIAEAMERDMGILATTLRDMPERHRSMRAVFNRSWEQLSPEEQGALAGLSVFRGGFRWQAARAVAGANLGILSSLVDRSWLRATPSGRYKIHELVRQYAAEHLRADKRRAEHPEGGHEWSDQVREHHGRYYAAYLKERESDLLGGRQKKAFQEILEEMDNVRAAWNWAVERRDVVAIGQCVRALEEVTELRGWHYEMKQAFGDAADILRQQIDTAQCREDDDLLAETRIVLAEVLLSQSLECWQLDLRTQARALLEEILELLGDAGHGPRQRAAVARSTGRLGYILWTVGEATEADRMMREALAYFEEVDDSRYRVAMRMLLAAPPHHLGRYEEAEEYHRQGAIIADKAGDLRYKAFMLDYLSMPLCDRGDYEAARRAAEEALQIRQELGDRMGTRNSHMQLATIATALRDYELARQHYQEALVLSEDMSTPEQQSQALRGLGTIALEMGQYVEAKRRFEEALARAREGESKNIHGLIALGHATCALGELDRSRQCFREGLDIALRRNRILEALDAVVGMAELLAREGRPEQAVELLALAAHHPSTRQLTRDKAQELLSELESALAPQILAAAMARGRARELEEVVEILDEG